jgi:hypothetical protein
VIIQYSEFSSEQSKIERLNEEITFPTQLAICSQCNSVFLKQPALATGGIVVSASLVRSQKQLANAAKHSTRRPTWVPAEQVKLRHHLS